MPKTATSGHDMATITMDDLLATSDIKCLKVGDVVEGTITSLRKHEVWIDLGANGVGVVLRREIGQGQKLEEGEKVTTCVIDPELEDGVVLLSMKRAAKDRGWDELQNIFESEEKREERAHKFKTETQYISVKWLNANPNATIIVEDKQSTYYSYVIKNGNEKPNTVMCSGYSKLIYKNLVLGIEVVDLACIYETVFRKIPLAELEEVWFLENLTKRHRIYEIFKRPVEILLTIVIGIVTLPLVILVAAFIKIISSGPIIFTQQRTGKNDSVFTIYKFRTMRIDAEKDGPQWAKENDKRILPLGNILRKSHLDEWPQLLNILRGDLSLVGPRPERPEFIKDLQKDIPYYDLRHLIRPGVTGWAQINYRYGASIEDAYEKLQYDMYYLKNRSIILDILIILKTIKLLFTSAK